MATLTSTVPGAVSLLKTYMATVAAANSSLDCGVYTGIPIENVTNNYMMIGNWETGQLITGYDQEFAGINPAVANRKDEHYDIMGSVRTWAGDSDPVTRLTELFTLLDGLMGLFASDPNGSGVLTSSGTWQMKNIEIPSSGPFGGKGWGVLATFDVQVFNVRLQS